MDTSTPTINHTCPLCHSSSVSFFHRDQRRDYLRCEQCQLVFVPSEQHLSAVKERAIYDLHENDPDDNGYRCFLSRLTDSLTPYLTSGACGLDFGCGPASAIPVLLPRHNINLYDPFYANEPALLNHRYDFITCTEVIEHFRHPEKEFRRLFTLLKPHGQVGIMTKLVKNAQAFSRWHYKNDLTHISFYSIATLSWLARAYNKRISFYYNDVIIFY